MMTLDDAISRQAVLDTLDTADKFMDEDRTIENYKALLKECYEVLPPVTQKSAKDYLDMADRKAKKIKDALTVTHMSGEWIPVRERLPKEGEEVLVTVYDTYNKRVIISRYQGEQYGFACGLVSAWMPLTSLPKPYEPQESEDIQKTI